jgi:hypothetical protein
VTEDVQGTGATAQIQLEKYAPFTEIKELGFTEGSRQRVLVGKDENGSLKIITLILP